MQSMPSPAALPAEIAELATVAAAGQTQLQPLNTTVQRQYSEIQHLGCQPHSPSDRLGLKASVSTAATQITVQSLQAVTPVPPNSQPTQIPAPEPQGDAALTGLPGDEALETHSPPPTLPTSHAPASYADATQPQHQCPAPSDYTPNQPLDAQSRAPEIPLAPEESELEIPPPAEPGSGPRGNHSPNQAMDKEGRESGPPTKRMKGSAACAHGRLRWRCCECRDAATRGQAP
jgi:hypothetical protein